MAKQHAYRLIDSAAVAKNLSPIGDVPKTESVVRPLARLEPAQQREVWVKAGFVWDCREWPFLHGRGVGVITGKPPSGTNSMTTEHNWPYRLGRCIAGKASYPCLSPRSVRLFS